MDYYFVTYGLTIISLIITILAQIFVSSTYSKYSKVRNKRGITGAEAARAILDKNGLEKVNVVETSGYLSDHYDPTHKVVRLSTSNYRNDSIGAVAVACHECGHAIQDKEGYIFMIIRSQIVPIVNFASYAGYIAIVVGMFFGSMNLIWIGILSEIAILIFQLITLPVEIDASKKALKELENSNYLTQEELNQSKIILTSAALTYVASVANTLIQILRLILIYGRRDD